MRGRSITYFMRALPFGNFSNFAFQSEQEGEIFVGPPLKKSHMDPFMGSASMDE